jgi:hypothetical protein
MKKLTACLAIILAGCVDASSDDGVATTDQELAAPIIVPNFVYNCTVPMSCQDLNDQTSGARVTATFSTCGPPSMTALVKGNPPGPLGQAGLDWCADYQDAPAWILFYETSLKCTMTTTVCNSPGALLSSSFAITLP